MMKALALPSLVLAALLAGRPVGAAQLIEISGDWQSFSDTDAKGKRVCFTGSHPVKSEGKYAKRGEPFLLITHWAADKVFGEVRYDAGYILKKDTPVTVTVGATTVALTRTDGESAWTDRPQDDAALVAAIRAGVTLVVHAVSDRGTKTTDTFSLKGSGDALDAIDRVCKKK